MKCRGFATGWKRAAVTAAVVYALVLQGLLLSLGGALHAVEAAAGPQTIICAEGSATGQDRAPAKAHDGLCCILGCHGGAAAGPLPVFAALKQRVPAPADIRPSGHFPALRIASHVLPLGSRAPPRLG
jgi:hypothetical protein